MKHFFAFCRRNRLFAALLAAELAVVCALAAGLFGAPYKLTLTPRRLYKHPARHCRRGRRRLKNLEPDRLSQRRPDDLLGRQYCFALRCV
ncbi:hypothetical protein [Gemmiger formicilis]|uniref:hypothetical protein n=1 Tax=Gemmiger formicilis TaxID=745368 RepID=UPI0035221D84